MTNHEFPGAGSRWLERNSPHRNCAAAPSILGSQLPWPAIESERSCAGMAAFVGCLNWSAIVRVHCATHRAKRSAGQPEKHSEHIVNAVFAQIHTVYAPIHTRACREIIAGAPTGATRRHEFALFPQQFSFCPPLTMLFLCSPRPNEAERSNPDPRTLRIGFFGLFAYSSFSRSTLASSLKSPFNRWLT